LYKSQDSQLEENPEGDLDDDEEMNQYIPWYMVNEAGKFMVAWNMIFAALVLFNFLYAPFINAFNFLRQSYKDEINSLENTIEFFWAFSILVNFVTASNENKIFTVKESSKKYLQSHGVPDIFALFGNFYINQIMPGKANSI